MKSRSKSRSKSCILGVAGCLFLLGCTATPIAPPPSTGASFVITISQQVPAGVQIHGTLFLTAHQGNPNPDWITVLFKPNGDESYYGYDYKSSKIPNDLMILGTKLEVKCYNSMSGQVIADAPSGTVAPFSPDGSGKYRLQ